MCDKGHHLLETEKRAPFLLERRQMTSNHVLLGNYNEADMDVHSGASRTEPFCTRG